SLVANVLFLLKEVENLNLLLRLVRMTLEPHPLQPGWRSLDSKSFGYRAEDTIEAIALHG
ncbi:hypothetical protein ACJX0J_012403, partial [Zea mays]